MAPNADHQDQQAADSVEQHAVAYDELKQADGKRASESDERDSTNDGTSDATAFQYDVEHLATFSTTASSHETPNGEGELVTNLNKLNNRQQQHPHHPQSQQARLPQQHQSASEPRVALQRLFELEKLSGIWTQRMQIQLKGELMLILDCETNSIVERFHRNRVQKPEAFNQYNGIYNNIIVFIIDQQDSSNEYKEVRSGDDSRKSEYATDCDNKTTVSGGELHIFQCVSHRAKQLVSDILSWKSGRPIEIDEEQQRQQQRQQESKQLTTSDKQEHQGSPLAQETTNDNNMMIVKKTSAPSVTSLQADKKTTTTTKKQVNQLAGDGLRQNTNNNGSDAQQNDVSKPSNTAATTTASSSNESSTSTGDIVKPPVVTVASSSAPSENVPIVNVNVKETVQVFNQIAALREKGSTAGNNQTPSSVATPTTGSNRPLSSEVSAASSGQADGISRVSALSGQFIKQRSIRATLAPKPTPASDEQHQQQGSSTADSSMASSGVDGKAACSSVPADSSSSSSRSELPNGRSSKAPPPPPPPAPNHKSRRDTAAELTTNAVKSSSDGGRHLNGSTYTQSSSCSSSSSGQRPAVKEAANSKASAASGARLSSGHNELSSNHRHQQSSSDSSTRRSLGSPALSSQQQQLEQVTTNESYVSVLNHCFDDIEKFIIRLQHAYAAMHELQAKRRHSKKLVSGQPLALTSSGHHKSHLANGGGSKKQQPAAGPAPPLSASELALLSARARGPNSDDFFEILSKFKLAFNLLAKLKGCIHEPNAPELVHFLFTPLAIIIESARNVSPAVDPALVGIPYLNKDALELLSNCCTSKESDLWISLGPNWTQTIEPSLLKASRLPSSFQPIFSDGWAPVISELELIGLVAAPAAIDRAELVGGHYRSSRAICAPSNDPDLFEPATLSSAGASHKTSEPASMKSSATSGAQQPPVNGKLAHHKKRISPIPQDPYASSRQLHKSQYGPAGYLQEIAVVEPSAYRVPKTVANQRASRQSIPKVSRRHPSDVYAAGHFSPPVTDGYLDDRAPYYPSGYPTNPSDDYTELQDDHMGAGPSGRRRQSSRVTEYKLYDPSVQPPLLDRTYADRLAYLPGDEPSLASAYHHQRQHYIDEAEREAMLLDLGSAQTEWFFELTSRGALIVRVLFTRDANNDKELNVKRGEVLEILDDSRKWWKARNIDLQVAYVPHTIVAVMDHYQTLDELLTNTPAELLMGSHDSQPPAPSMMNSRHRGYARRELQPIAPMDPNGYAFREDHRRNSKTSRGAFRYF